MNSLDFAIQLVSVTIWPVTIVILVTILRYPVQNLLTRLRAGELPGVKLNFDAGPNMSMAVLEQFEYETLPSRRSSLEIDNDYCIWLTAETVHKLNMLIESKLAPALQISGSNPAAAVLTAYRHVEIELYNRYAFTRATQGYTDSKMPLCPDVKTQVDYLRGKATNLGADVYDTVLRMENFHNKIRNGGQPSLSAAAMYVDTAIQVCWLLEPPVIDEQLVSSAIERVASFQRRNEASIKDSSAPLKK